MLIPFKELFERHKVTDCKRILHVGAHSGEEADYYASMGVTDVHWIEADPRTYGKLVQRIQNFKGQYALNACISDDDGTEVDFHVASNGGQSSSILDFGTHAKMHPDCTWVGSFKLKTVRLDTLFNSGRLPTTWNFDLVNVDVQGLELQVLKGMGVFLSTVKYLYLEVNKDHVYSSELKTSSGEVKQGCALVGEIDAYVAQFGFKRVETMWASANLSWGDGFFIKQ